MLSTWWGRVLAVLALAVILAGIAGGIYRREITQAYRQWRNALPHGVLQRLQSAKSVTLYSLYPEAVHSPAQKMSWIDDMSWDELLSLPRLHGYPVLGKFECSDPSILQVIANELRDGTQLEGPNFMCFLPRHGMQLTDGEGSIELLICYDCQRLELYEDGKLTSHHIIAVQPSWQSISRWNAEFAGRGIRMADTKP